MLCDSCFVTREEHKSRVAFVGVSLFNERRAEGKSIRMLPDILTSC